MEKAGRTPFSFQKNTWHAYSEGLSGMVVAPTGFGKTYSVFLGILIDFMNRPENYGKGLKMVWVTPLRSLAKDIGLAMQSAIDEIGLDWTVGVRNGDTDIKVRQKQLRSMPDILLVTPESFQLLFTHKNSSSYFKSLRCVVVDEWHELLGTKRGVLTELCIAHVRSYNIALQVWGITATIGNLQEAQEVLLYQQRNTCQIVAKEKKKTQIIPVLPDEVEVLPWAGHLGAKMAGKVVDIILGSRSTIVFTNTRSQSEMWYQLLLDAYPDFAGQIAIHHSSIDAELRTWIEESLSSGKLKAVVSTSSLDLGVDFKPVDTVIQIGSVKGVARFMQRAGRSGHSPFEVSKIYCVPTHSLELIEVAAVKQAVRDGVVERRDPMVLTFDVLAQFTVSLAVGEGFYKEDLWTKVQRTHAFSYMSESEFHEIVDFLVTGGGALKNYSEFKKIEILSDGLFKVQLRKIAMLHRMNMGVIVSDAMMKVKFISGGYIGMVEEYFLSRLRKDEKFILAGRVLELVMIKEMTAYVRSSKGQAVAPSYLGGRLPLSSDLGRYLREKLSGSLSPKISEKELKFLHPVMQKQLESSHLPQNDEFLVEVIENRDGHHVFMYPFEGRAVHEVMATLIGLRISRISNISLSMAMNDYGFELYSDKPIPVSQENIAELLRSEGLMRDVEASINAAEMARRKFRDIAVISGLVLQNLYGKQRNNKSLQASAGLIFSVLEEHNPSHILIRQAYNEVFNQQLEEVRLTQAFERINSSKIIVVQSPTFTPLSFPIKVDSLRSMISSETLKERIHRMQLAALKKKGSRSSKR
ncbi:ligase-associated DNA damage response DEXH box helicase [Planobacterium sp. GCR5]|uniref:Ligase-associated DNA damage response DEXH box helicase n=2 Tax=Planobacterium oryzisoli TaxID=2771435 RepID=A0A930YW15_9FLAO|nr:ligase-associated DNA damage response DEXH box helicase [Planobacterium oryzisoli]